MHARVCDHAGSAQARAVACARVAFRYSHNVGTRDDRTFAAQWLALPAPLPTLRACPRGHARTAWGRCGLLALHRNGLSPSTPCRSPGALPLANSSD